MFFPLTVALGFGCWIDVAAVLCIAVLDSKFRITKINSAHLLNEK